MIVNGVSLVWKGEQSSPEQLIPPGRTVESTFDDATRPAALHHRVDAAVVIRDQQHARRVRAGGDRLADHAER